MENQRLPAIKTLVKTVVFAKKKQAHRWNLVNKEIKSP
jgi:hypothetical protein